MAQPLVKIHKVLSTWEIIRVLFVPKACSVQCLYFAYNTIRWMGKSNFIVALLWQLVPALINYCSHEWVLFCMTLRTRAYVHTCSLFYHDYYYLALTKMRLHTILYSTSLHTRGAQNTHSKKFSIKFHYEDRKISIWLPYWIDI